MIVGVATLVADEKDDDGVDDTTVDELDDDSIDAGVDVGIS
jgi:hypothetical protein